jgi:general secretion pathway protein E
MILTEQTDTSNVFEPKGCDWCNHLGYKGRTGIYEIIPIDEPLRGMVHRNEPIQTLESYIRPNTPSIREDGFKRVLCGDTSLAEILRVTSHN